VGDIFTEVASTAGGTADAVISSVTYTLATGVERLQLSGGQGLKATGNGLGNVLIGNTGANTLDGKGGADTMSGGAGNDVYLVDNLGDMASEALTVNQGTDSVFASVSFVLGQNLENLTLTGTGNLNGTGSAQNNLITGNAGANTLDGAGGSDKVLGFAGNDTLIYDASDSTLDGGTGMDHLRVLGAANLTLPKASLVSIEYIDLVGTNSLVLTPAAVLGLSEATNELVVTGDADDSVSTSAITLGQWRYIGSSDGFVQYTAGGATLTIAEAIDRSGLNAAPAPGDFSSTTPEDTALTLTVSDLLGAASDLESDTLSLLSVSGASGGTVTLNAGVVTYTPNPDTNGPDSFTYIISDGTSTSAGTATIAVTPVADLPTAVADTASMLEDAPVSINVLANDLDTDSTGLLAVTAVTTPAHGVLVETSPGVYAYTPEANYFGSDSFTYSLSNDGGLTTTSGTVEVMLTVSGVLNV
jgi:hypothetical protein